MIYNLNGKYDSFSMDCDSDLNAITVALLLAANNAVYFTDPKIGPSQDNYANELLELYRPFGTYDEYVRQNCGPIIKFLDSVVSGGTIERRNFEIEQRNIDLDLELDEQTKKELQRNLRVAFIEENLFVRLQQLKSILVHTHRVLEKQKEMKLEDASIQKENDV